MSISITGVTFIKDARVKRWYIYIFKVFSSKKAKEHQQDWLNWLKVTMHAEDIRYALYEFRNCSDSVVFCFVCLFVCVGFFSFYLKQLHNSCFLWENIPLE